MDKILYVGDTGVGKSRAITKLDPKTTLLLQCTKKRLPNQIDKEYVQGKNRFLCDTNDDVLNYITGVSNYDTMKHIKTIVVDDWSFASTKELMMRSNERGFEKFTDVALSLVKVVNAVDTGKDGVSVVFVTHLEHEIDGSVHVKTGSKFIREKWGLFEMFEIVLQGNKDYSIKTNGSPAKSPEGMFKPAIENDMKMILETIDKYYK